jgi:hypothetical protein
MKDTCNPNGVTQMKTFLKLMAVGFLAGSLVAFGGGAWIAAANLAFTATSALCMSSIIAADDKEEESEAEQEARELLSK